MILSIAVCIASLFWLLAVLRRRQPSLGLPLAYLAGLLVIHLPGAFAHLVDRQTLPGTDETALGMIYTAIATACFVAGVWFARYRVRAPAVVASGDRTPFALFCLVGGWIVIYGLYPLEGIPSLGAAIDKGGAIWLLGAMLGLRGAFSRVDFLPIVGWLGALMVYPATSLLLGGFLSYGSLAIIIASSELAIGARTYGRAAIGVVLASVIGLNFFVNYFEHRDDIRDQVWGGASMSQRIDSVSNIFTEFHLFSPDNSKDLDALNLRLNQNIFVGLAAERIQDDEVGFLYGRSVTEGAMALVPRAFWPDKPVYAGSPEIVAEMTGLQLSKDTSWGVGNVMEFYINFGVAGLVAGFFGLGWLLGFLDVRAAIAERAGNFGAAILFFLPAVAIIQPGGSMVEIVGGGAAAIVAAFGWRELWKIRSRSRRRAPLRPGSSGMPRAGRLS
jgi:hypothetical protein